MADSLRCRLVQSLALLGGATVLLSAGLGPAAADKIRNTIAVFEGLDKITGRLLPFEVTMNETVQFGALQVTPRACFTRPPTEAPQTTTFVEIDEISPANNDYKRIFGGWMYAASPGLHALEHPIYDVWLTDCKGGNPEKDLIHTAPETAAINDAAPVAVAPKPQTASPTPKAGTVPRPRKAAGEPGITLPGIPLPGETVTSEPLPPPVATARKKPSQRYYPTNVPPSSDPPPAVAEPKPESSD